MTLPTATPARNEGKGGSPNPFERHFSLRTLAEHWCISEDTVRRWAENEDGVLRFGSEGKRTGARRITIRVPETVALRMYERHTSRRR